MTELDQALAHHQAGRLKEAEAQYREILAREPEHSDALHGLGVLTAHSGNPQSAVALIEQAIASNPHIPDYHHNLGEAYRALQAFDQAITAYQRALALNSDLPVTLFSLGNVYQAQGQLEQAIEAFERALTFNPDAPEIYNNIGVTRQAQGRLDQAIVAFERARAINPEIPASHYNLGNALQAQGKLDQAIIAYERALSLNPDAPETYNNIGVIRQAQGKPEQAIAAYQQALALEPDHIGTLGNLADMYERSNRLDDARSTATRGLALCADDALLNLTAATCERHEGRVQEAIARLVKINLSDLKPSTAATINYELGKLYNRSGDHARAFAHFSEGNRLLSHTARQRDVDKGTARDEIDTLDAQLTEGWVSAWSAGAHSVDAESPVFFIGFPRSGTTLLEQVLSSHPRLQTLEEKGTVSEVVNLLAALPGSYPSALATLSAENIAQLRRTYFQVVAQALDREPGCILIDKLPLNILKIPVIHRVFPHAKFIVSVRHPCDVCLSCFMQSFELNPAMANFLTLEDTTAFYIKVMALWQKCLRVLPLDYHLVRYEDLVERFEHETRRVLEFIGVGWDEAVLGYAEHARRRETIATPSYHEVTEPIFQRAKYRWRHYAKELEPYMHRLAPYIEYFAYTDASEQ